MAKPKRKKKATIKRNAGRRIRCAWKAAKRRNKRAKKLTKKDFKRCK